MTDHSGQHIDTYRLTHLRRDLTRRIGLLFVSLLLLIGAGSGLFSLAVATKLVKLPSSSTAPALAPEYLTATAAARAYAADTASIQPIRTGIRMKKFSAEPTFPI